MDGLIFDTTIENTPRSDVFVCMCGCVRLSVCLHSSIYNYACACEFASCDKLKVRRRTINPKVYSCCSWLQTQRA